MNDFMNLNIQTHFKVFLVQKKKQLFTSSAGKTL